MKFSIVHDSRRGMRRINEDRVGHWESPGALLMAVADGLGCTLAQLSLAWCVHNPRVSTVITGASRVEQVQENLSALEVVPQLTEDVIGRIEEAVR